MQDVPVYVSHPLNQSLRYKMSGLTSYKMKVLMVQMRFLMKWQVQFLALRITDEVLMVHMRCLMKCQAQFGGNNVILIYA